MKVNKLITHKNGTLFLSITIAKKKKRKWKRERSNTKCTHDIRCNTKIKVPLSRITKPYTATGYITIPQPYFMHECTYERSP